MNKPGRFLSQIPIYCLVFMGILMLTLLGNDAVTVMSENARLETQRCIIIDAGHGGVDGGATSCSGVLESQINLQIALRLDDLLHLLGYRTEMIRTEDISVYTQGETIAAKKISDLKERVRIVNSKEEGILVSIHQNYFSDSRYSGAQVFYPKTEGSERLAKDLQRSIVSSLNVGSNRQAKPVSGVYLMEHIQNTGILIECGFISNPEEEVNLRSAQYQKKLCCVIAASVGKFLLS